MIRYKCTVSYIGRQYCGFQSQRKNNSVQEILQAALSRIFDEPVTITASGRTDAKVNARGQVFHFDSEKDKDENKLLKSINSLLPDDIHIMLVEKKDALFHARYCVAYKTYRYRIKQGTYSVFEKDYTYFCPYTFDVQAMREASKLFIGTHDFTSYNSTSLQEIPNQTRRILSIDFVQEGDALSVYFTGKGFLRYMVRMLMGELLEVGRGRKRPEDIMHALKHPDKSYVTQNVPAQGLTLWEVHYFKLLAETDDFKVRERIPSDEVDDSNAKYVIENRGNQELVGTVSLQDKTVSITLFEPTEASKENALKEALQTYCDKNALVFRS